MNAKRRIRRSRKPRKRGPVLTVLLAPSYWSSAAIEALMAWYYTRHWFQFVFCAPFALALVTFWAFAMLGLGRSPTLAMQTYVRQALEAKESNRQSQYATASWRLVDLPISDENRFRVAMTLLQAGGEAEAEQHVWVIAPEDRARYGDAHYWIASRLVTGSIVDMPMPDERLVHHASAAYRLLPDSAYGQAIWGQVLLRLGKELEGLELLERAADKLPEISLTVAQLHSKMGNLANAKRFLDRAETHFRSEVVKDAENIAARRSLIQTIVLKGDLNSSLNVAEEGFRKIPSPASKQLLLETLSYAYDALPVEQRMGVFGFQRIRRSLELETRERASLQRLVKLVVLQSEAEWDSIRKQMESEIAQGKSNAVTRMLLAVGYAEHQDVRASQFHLQQAIVEDPGAAFLAGNIALVAIEMEDPELVFAEAWLKILMKAIPNRTDFRELRGRLYLVDGRYKEAIEDLKGCLSDSQSRDRVISLLADAYEKDGQVDLARSIRDQMSGKAAGDTSVDEVLQATPPLQQPEPLDSSQQ